MLLVTMRFSGALLVLALAFGFAHSVDVVCYFTNWATYRTGIAKYSPSDINATLCTRINYAFVGLLGETGELRVLDPWSDDNLGNLKGVVDLKKTNPKLKVLAAMGGWNEGSLNYSTVARNYTLRKNLVKSVLAYLEKNNFDGFELDWEYPAARGGDDKDVNRFVKLLCQLKKAFRHKKYLLTIAVAGAGLVVDESYDVDGIFECVDYVNVMAYDFRTATSVNYTAHHSPLYPSLEDVARNQQEVSVSEGVQQWLAKGANRSKLILGIPFYADTFKLVDPQQNGLYAPTNGQGDAGPLTATPGFLSYQEICYYYNNYTYVWDKGLQAPYAYQNLTWFGFDDPRSVKLKTQYVLDNKLAGVMIWTLDFDDFNDSCNKGKYPLLTTIAETIKENQ